MTHRTRPRSGSPHAGPSEGFGPSEAPREREDAPRDVHPDRQSGRTFGPQRRVRKRGDFQIIQGHGRRVPTRHFVLLLRARGLEQHDGARLGITASKRIGNAVVRNRVKRIVREAFRHADKLFAADIDVVVLVRADASALAPSEVLAEWRKVADRVRRAADAARGDRSQRPAEPQTRTPRSRGRGA